MKRYGWFAALLLLLVISASQAGSHNAYQLPEDRGAAGTLAALEKLPVYVRVLHTTAHPDDESAGTLTWLSRKFHAQTALFSLTRGEGGQNILGNEKYEALGLVRTGELLEACRYYDTELFFGSNVDFGFSKTAEETLSKWGHDAALEEMVRFIRWYRPTIIISQFQGDPGDGHGHHQAAGILTREAFRAAADPQKFPEQLKLGFQCWQTKKLFVSARPWREPPSGAEKTQIVRVPVGDYDPVLGRSYREIATEGYSKHRTQGNGTAYSLPGRAYESFALADSVAGNQQNGNTFFDSIDTSLMAIWELAGNEKQTVSFLREDLAEVQRAAEEALAAYQVSHPEKSATAAARGARILGESIKQIGASPLSQSAKENLTGALNQKLQDFQKAVGAALGIHFVARTDDAIAVAGDEVPITLHFYNQGPEKVTITKILFSSAGIASDFNWSNAQPDGKQVAGGSSEEVKIPSRILSNARVTEPNWHLNKSTDTRYTVTYDASKKENAFAPFGPAETMVEARYSFHDVEFPVYATPAAQAGDPLRGVDIVDFQVVPPLSVDLNPAIQITPTGPDSKSREFQVSVLNDQKSGALGTLKLVAPEKWQVDPGEVQFNLARKGEAFAAKFLLQIPAGTKPGSYPIEAVAVMGNQEFRRGYKVISYPENWTRNIFSNAQSRIERFDIKVAPNLLVGYIPGAGDDIPAALEQLGVKTQILSAADLAFGDLHRFATIITGIRAYNVNEALRANNQRILNYVAQGGSLIVQYVRPMGRMGGSTGSSFPFGPFPMSVSDSDRITVEDSPIKILDPANPVFAQPNKITMEDFQGWVQERGLYFMNSWDERYTALLSGNDPGEPPKNGGMLYARYGKGRYIYTGYSWFRQLPAGNHGAFRIFANMISLGSLPGAPASRRHE
jgi:LmbE family N-acetylglucosaminyl deacetylase